MDSPAILPRIDFYTARNGRRLAVRVWRSAGPPLARVVCLHGITSHGGWYCELARHLASADLRVHFLDRRGSGLNAEEPGDVDNWHTWIDDVATYLGGGCKGGGAGQQCDLPTILCGISWGGKLAPAVARRHPALVNALALICPGIYSPFLPGPLKRTVLAAPAPNWIQRRRVSIPLRESALFTNSRRWQEHIERDPLALRRVTWRFAREDRRLTQYARESASFMHMPMLMMLAGQDRIVDNERTRRFFSEVAGRQKTLIEYPGAAHTLEFEGDSTAYFESLAGWIRGTVGALNGGSNNNGDEALAG